MRFFLLIILLWCAGMFLNSCRKDVFNTDPSFTLSFSRDTVMFDTVFTTQGSAVRRFRVFNTSNKRIKINSVSIAGGEASNFRLNVNGVPGKSFADVVIEPRDSIYIFAAVTIDPTDENNPFVVTDSIWFQINGNQQKVLLMAYGQNAYFHYGERIQNDTIWPIDKPHVVINSLVVDSFQTLYLQAGTRMYMHANSALFVYGTLNATGTKNDSIVFQGDRLENYFKDLPGNWGYIRFLRSSEDNYLEHVIIKDALIGVICDSLSNNTNYKVSLNKCVIKNMFYSGISAASGSVRAENCLIHSCGDYCAQLYYGGDYRFDHCTFANYSNTVINHQKPSFLLTNFFVVNNIVYSFPFTNALIRNCIIYGGLEDELLVDSVNASGYLFDYTFTNCNIRTTSSLDNNYLNTQQNQNPLFEDFSEQLFGLPSSSPCKNAGITIPGITDDICDKPRDAQPDIGAYEIP
jgi:hypothetical protein